jgi:hypothetical protein
MNVFEAVIGLTIWVGLPIFATTRVMNGQYIFGISIFIITFCVWAWITCYIFRDRRIKSDNGIGKRFQMIDKVMNHIEVMKKNQYLVYIQEVNRGVMMSRRDLDKIEIVEELNDAYKIANKYNDDENNVYVIDNNGILVYKK